MGKKIVADRVTKEKRSWIMSRIRSTDTKPEIALRKALWAAGLRGYRLHARLSGSPDIAFTRRKVAVFVDGCFWHGCPVCYREPKTEVPFWRAKVAGNRERDGRVDTELAGAGWRVVRIWEHEIRRDMAGCVDKVRKAIEGGC